MFEISFYSIYCSETLKTISVRDCFDFGVMQTKVCWKFDLKNMMIHKISLPQLK